MSRKYYEAYDERYKQVHRENLQWFSDTPSPIVSQTMSEFQIRPSHKILELGCGEGRDARFLLNLGFRVMATDISSEAIAFCKNVNPQYAEQFQVLDCINGHLDDQFDFIYAVAVVHMLVLDADRSAFYRFIRDHLKPSGIALICTMGDGENEFQSDIGAAFDLRERNHQQTGRTLCLAGTSCRVVNFDTLKKELQKNGLRELKMGLTSVEPDFPKMLYAVVRRESLR